MVSANVSIIDGDQVTNLPFVETLDVQLTEGRHDLVSLTTGRLASKSLANTLSGKPVIVSVQLGFGAVLVLRGYLDMSAPVRAVHAVDSFTHVLGVTSSLRTNNPRGWQNRLPEDIVSEVLAPYKLGIEFDSSLPIDFISQASGESDWQFLSKLAKRIGFSLSSDGVVVRFIDAHAEERRSLYYSVPQLIIPSSSSPERNVTVFKMLSSVDPADAGYKETVVQGADSLHQHFSYSTAFLHSRADIQPEFAMSQPSMVSCLRQAETEAERVVKQARWTNVAEALCVGFVDAKPGRCVLVVDRDGQYGGYWLVTDVHHILNVKNDTVVTSVTVCRDALKLSTTQRPVQVPPSKPPLPRLVNSRWQADRHWSRALS